MDLIDLERARQDAGARLAAAQNAVREIGGRLYQGTAKGQAAKDRDLSAAYAEVDAAQAESDKADADLCEAQGLAPLGRGRGRPKIGSQMQVALSTDQLAWLDEQNRPRAETIRALIDQARTS